MNTSMDFCKDKNKDQEKMRWKIPKKRPIYRPRNCCESFPNFFKKMHDKQTYTNRNFDSRDLPKMQRSIQTNVSNPLQNGIGITKIFKIIFGLRKFL